jgi:putative ABC transport system substrate-binding protein
VKPFLDEFRARLAERGYVEGMNLDIDVGHGEADAMRFPAVAEQLIARKPDVLVGLETAARAMRARTTTIPIVLWTSIDPVGVGLVQSLARPGTNVTGMVDLWDQLTAKHVELLAEIAPQASRLGVLIDPLWSARTSYEDFARKAAESKRLKLTIVPVVGASELKQAFMTFENEKVEILLIASMARMFALRREIAEGARRLRLPSVFGAAAYAEGGGVLSYGPNLLDNMRHVAEFVDRILKGASPADLPLRQTTKYEFVINLKAAREIGVTIPQSILVRADRVIE